MKEWLALIHNKNQIKIMIVEDESLILKAIATKMTKKGLKTLPFSSGKTAVKYLEEAHKEEVLPDAIWLDYYLRDINGIEFMNKIKNIEGLPKIPIVVVSNSAEGDNIENMLGLGAEKYFLKAEHTLENLIEATIKLVQEEKKDD